jgi:hypothetical protein
VRSLQRPQFGKIEVGLLRHLPLQFLDLVFLTEDAGPSCQEKSRLRGGSGSGLDSFGPRGNSERLSGVYRLE